MQSSWLRKLGRPEIARFAAVILLFASVAKLSDPFLFFRAVHSVFTIPSVILDLFLGCWLLGAPTSRVAATVGCVLFFGYATFHLFAPTTACDCLGPSTEYVGDTGVLALSVLGCFALLVCTLSRKEATGKNPSAGQRHETGFRSQFTNAFGVCLGVLIVAIMFRAQTMPPVLGFAKLAPAPETPGLFHGVIQVFNRTDRSLEIVGVRIGVCRNQLQISEDSQIEAHSSIQLDCQLSGKERIGFARGRLPLFVESHDRVVPRDLPWVGVVN